MTDTTDAGGAATDAALRLGILHLGRPESGVRRYGRIITEELAGRDGVHLTQTDAGLLEGRRGGLDQGTASATQVHRGRRRIPVRRPQHPVEPIPGPAA